MQAYKTVESCFKPDGPLGVAYEEYQGFHDWRDMVTSTQFQDSAMEAVLKQVPGLREKLGSLLIPQHSFRFYDGSEFLKYFFRERRKSV